ncbi:MAG: Ig-like domain-containing protein, partial [Actinomycetota bacterium]|nr:Ig-like domain-containing protein [Actinomycetota bacterium]
LDSRGIVDFHWNSDQHTAYPGPIYTYDPAFVNPTQLTVQFNACQSAKEQTQSETNVATINQYTWQVFDRVTNQALTQPFTAKSCLWAHTFALDAHTFKGPDTRVQLTIRAPSAAAETHTQSIQVQDHLIVALGDSYASGEGSPDIPIPGYHWQPLPPGFFGNTPAVWEDRRCHRSSYAPSAQAAQMVIKGDPHTSVTYISFACSGADINTDHLNDTSSVDPYYDVHGHQHLGTGILGPYAGNDPHLYSDPLPSQISQMTAAVGNRTIDALLVDGGGNDMNFASIATVCTIAWDCANQHVFRGSDVTTNHSDVVTLDQRVQDDLNGVVLNGRFVRPSLASLYDQYARAICNPDGTGSCTRHVGKVLAMEYPDPTNGGTCQRILDDAVPAVALPILSAEGTVYLGETGNTMRLGDLNELPIFGIFNWASYQGFPPGNSALGDEVKWAADRVLGAPGKGGLNGSVYAGVAAHANDSIPWRYVGGIASAFNGHGYCSRDNWIRRADEAQYVQGGSDGNGASDQSISTLSTQGKFHPNSTGYQAMALQVLQPLYQLAGSGTPLPPPATFAGTAALVDPSDGTTVTDAATLGTNGWLVGSNCSAACAVAVPHTVFRVEASTPSVGDPVTRANLTINGAVCSTPPAGVTCDQVSPTDETYRWSMSFAADGIYQVSSSVTDATGATTNDTREVKVDLTAPTAAVALSPSTPQSAGVYTTPVVVTLTGNDAPGGSGLQGVRYQLDADPTALAGDGATVTLGQGTHTLTYWAVDWAGNEQSAHQTLSVTVKLLVSLAVTPSQPSAPRGSPQQFGATGTYTDGTTADLTHTATWASSDITGATIDAAGLASARHPGTSTISATQGTVTGSTVLTVTPAPLEVRAPSVSAAYGSATPTSFVPSYVGLVEGDTQPATPPTCTSTGHTGSPAGVYPITCAGGADPNYAFAYTAGTLTITRVPLTVTADNQSRVYGQANPPLTYTIAGFVNADPPSVVSGAPTLATAVTPSSSVGSYPVNITAGSLSAANYTFGFVAGTLSVAPAPLTVTADNKVRLYSQPNPALTYTITGFVNGDPATTVSGSPVLATTAVPSSNAGSYLITVTTGSLSAANYTFGFAPGTLTVNPAPTSLSPSPAVLRFQPAGITLGTVSAKLTYGNPALPGAGQPIVFSVGRLTLCTATAGSDGTATCTTTAAGAAAVLVHLGYVATFFGSPNLLVSTGQGGLVK